MVHTAPLSRRDHLPHLPLVAAAAFSSATYFQFLHPKHAQYPDNAAAAYLTKIRKIANTPNVVVRVALADDADPYVDVGLKGHAAEQTAYIRGKWENGMWQSAELEDGQLKGKVCEGRIVGYTQWQRRWPEEAEDAKRAKELGGFGTIWPSDSLWKKFDRAAYGLADAYFARIAPNRAYSAENAALADGPGYEIFKSHSEAVMERCKHVGHIWLNAIAVDPAFYRRGIGARLMRWGIERAEVEGCPIMLIATAAGSLLYEKLGFQTLGTIDLNEFLHGDKVMVYWPHVLDGGDVMVYWPGQAKGEDVQQKVVDAVDDPAVRSEDDSKTKVVEA